VLSRALVLMMLLPVVEIVLLVWLARETSILFVLALLVAAGLLGAYLARHQGLAVLGRISRELEARRIPAESLVDAVLVSLAAVLLILPGVLSDAVAILLLVPFTRGLLKRAMRRSVQAHVVMRYGATASLNRDEIIDVKVIDSPPRS
jgi:UPF0716 protein FxsA